MWSITYPPGLPGNEEDINSERLIETLPLAPLQVLQLFIDLSLALTPNFPCR